MTASKTTLEPLAGFGATAALCFVLSFALAGCGSSGGVWNHPDAGPGGLGVGGPAGGCGLLCPSSSGGGGNGGGSGASTPAPPPPNVPAMGGAMAADCAGCTFPSPNAPSCAASAPAIQVLYPADGALLPPNMNEISVQWTPFGGFKTYEVDFSQSQQSPNTDWRIVTSCMTQTVDAQSGMPSGGCELVVDPTSWSKVVGANRGGGPVTVTVRGTTDGNCASASTNSVHVSFAEEDLIGTYYYWKSTVSMTGTGGQIWAQIFGNVSTPEKDVTTAALQNATCNGCHSLSRDGSRMVVYSDDDDSDDEYTDVAGSYLNMTSMPATEFMGGITGVRMGGQPPGFSAINPAASYYVTSNGLACTTAGGGRGGGGRGGGGGGCGSSNGYATAVPTNGFSLWNGTNGAFVNGVPIGPTGQRPTMPDWSIDGMTVVYVQPAGGFATIGPNATAWRQDDAHIYGGSLYTAPYSGNGTFGTATALLQSSGENNYYPSYSPDNPMSFVIFNRVDNMNAGATCTGSKAAAGFCLDDSFSNPAARLMLMGATSAGGMPVDLEKANGSPASAKMPLSNSYPRWAPFVQDYQGKKLMWFTFSSTRDYGVRVLNHKTGMYQCYPADSAEWPGGSHGGKFDAACQEPQLWMAPVIYAQGQAVTADPSGVAFWIPYQDPTTHNHTAQWTAQAGPPPANCACVALNQACANNACGCCGGATCSGNGLCTTTLR